MQRQNQKCRNQGDINRLKNHQLIHANSSLWKWFNVHVLLGFFYSRAHIKSLTKMLGHTGNHFVIILMSYHFSIKLKIVTAISITPLKNPTWSRWQLFVLLFSTISLDVTAVSYLQHNRQHSAYELIQEQHYVTNSVLYHSLCLYPNILDLPQW